MYIRYTITLKDAYGRKTQKVFEFLDSVVEIARPAMLDLLLDLDAIVAGQIISLQETVYVPLIANLKTNPMGGANVDEAFVFVGELNNARRNLYSLRVPTPKKSYVSADGSVDIENPDIRAFLDDFTGTVHIPVADGEKVLEFLAGRLEK